MIAPLILICDDVRNIATLISKMAKPSGAVAATIYVHPEE